MKLQLLMFVQDSVDETTAANVCIGLMKLQLQMFVQDGVDEITSTNVFI